MLVLSHYVNVLLNDFYRLNMADLMDLLTLCSELDEDLSNLSRGDNQRKERIRKHIHTVDTKLKYQVPDFEKGRQIYLGFTLH